MAKRLYVGNGNIARNTKSIYVGVNGVARNVKKGYIGVNGVARLFYSSTYIWKKYYGCKETITETNTTSFMRASTGQVAFAYYSGGQWDSPINSAYLYGGKYVYRMDRLIEAYYVSPNDPEDTSVYDYPMPNRTWIGTDRSTPYNKYQEIEDIRNSGYVIPDTSYLNQTISTVYGATSGLMLAISPSDWSYELYTKTSTLIIRTISAGQGEYIEDVISDNPNTYPINGRHTDGYWYVRQ